MIHEFLYQLNNCPVRQWPYPHFYLQGCFPDDYYAEILANLPPENLLRQIGEVRGKALRKYPERFAFPIADPNQLILLDVGRLKFWRDFTKQLSSAAVIAALDNKFASPGHYVGRKLRADILLVKDTVNYALGPHTDTPSKVISLLFYLPGDDGNPGLGTSIYVPRDPAQQFGAEHNEHADFHRVATMRYVPNSLFAFLRSDTSFHGVEPITSDVSRWLLQYNLYAA